MVNRSPSCLRKKAAGVSRCDRVNVLPRRVRPLPLGNEWKALYLSRERGSAQSHEFHGVMKTYGVRGVYHFLSLNLPPLKSSRQVFGLGRS